MTWYAAHLILYVKLKQKAQRRYPVWENIVLIKAASEEKAFAKAERRGQEQAGDDGGTFCWENEPAEWIFAGVRKLTLCEDENSRPDDGTEVSYLEMEVESRAALEHLLNGQPVRVLLRDPFPDDGSTNGAVDAGRKQVSFPK